MVDVDKIIEEETIKKDNSETKQEVKQEESLNTENKNDAKENRALFKKEETNLMNTIDVPKVEAKVDKTKTVVEQAEDVVNIMGAERASRNDKFMDEVSDNFQKGVLTEQETNNLRRGRLLEQEYFLKWQDVLQFAFIKSAHGLVFMKIMTIIAMIVYVPLRVIGMFVKAIGTLFDFVNDIFNSVFGGKGKYLRNKDGEVIIDKSTNKPYMEKQGYNLFAKILFGILIVGLGLALIFLFVKIFSGFDIFEYLRSLFRK